MNDQKINNGGPAFPIPLHPGQGWQNMAPCDGMSLRTYIAIEAMKMHGAAFHDADISGEEAWDEIVAKRAVKTADAMLRALEGGAA